MEKAILKTLIYASLFDYPLKVYEIHKWLIGKKVTLYQVEKAIEKLVQKGKCKATNGYYFLPGKASLVVKRKSREKQSAKYLMKAQLLTQILKFIPWIKLVGISGGLAMANASKGDDIDLFIVTDKNRLWISRILAIGILDFLRVRRKPNMKISKVAGKICLNILLEEDRLEQDNKDIFMAHEVLQMKVLWVRGGVYSKYLLDNEWVFKFLPNWISNARGSILSSPRPLRPPRLGKTGREASRRGSKSEPDSINWIPTFVGMTMMENLAKWLQLKIMHKPKGLERIEDGALYFHPNDCRAAILQEYKARITSTP